MASFGKRLMKYTLVGSKTQIGKTLMPPVVCYRRRRPRHRVVVTRGRVFIVALQLRYRSAGRVSARARTRVNP